MFKDPLKKPEDRVKMEHIVLSVFAITALLLVGFSLAASKIRPPEKKPVVEAPLIANPFHDIRLEAKAAYVYDLNTKTTYFEKNGESQLPLASLTKLLTAVTALELIPDYTLVTIDKEALKTDGDSGLKPDERFKLTDLINFTLLSSSNDGASAVASAVGAIERGTPVGSEREFKSNQDAFVEKMNAKAKALDLKQTFFLNPTGLDASKTTSGAYGSALDVTKLLAYILKNHPDMVDSTRSENQTFSSVDKKIHTVENTNKGMNGIPGLIGSKTGLTDLAGGNLVIAFDAGFGKPIIVTVLGSSEEGRFTDVNTLVWTTLQYLKGLNEK